MSDTAKQSAEVNARLRKRKRRRSVTVTAKARTKPKGDRGGSAGDPRDQRAPDY
jgi:hypothetical protein